MKLFSLLTIICFLSFVYPLLLKYDSQDTNDGYIVFDSSSFGEREEMHFNIKSLEFSFQQVLDYVEYCYLNSETDDIATIPSSYFYKAYFTSTS